MREGGGHHVGLSGRTVLVVEDEPLLALELVECLEALGARVIGPIPGIDEALTILESSTPLDAAIINVFLRGLVSFPVASALQARGLPFIFVTGNDEFVRTHYPDIPCHPKPADMPKIVSALAALLGNPDASPAR